MALSRAIPVDAEGAADWLTQLLPPGRYYQRPAEPGETVLDQQLQGCGDTAARIATAIDKALDECLPWLATDPTEAADPDQEWGWLSAWEAAFGLPDACTSWLGDNDDRRAALAARLAGRVGVRPADLVAAAAAIGWTITIDDGAMVARADGTCDAIMRGEGWMHTFIVRASAPTPRVLRCDGWCDGILVTYAVQRLKCLINELKPAHTSVYFDFT